MRVVCFLINLIFLFAVPLKSFAQKELVNYCVDPNWMPYEAIQKGEHIGLSFDYIQFVNDNTNYNFKLLPTDNWQQSLDYLKAGKCKIVPLLNKTLERSKYLDFSEVYFRSPNVLVSTKEEPFLKGFENIGNRSLGVTKGYRIIEFLNTFYPEIKTIEYETETIGLIAVSQGKADVFVGSMLSVNNVIQSNLLNNLKIAGWAGPEDKLRLGVIKGNAQLLDEIDKALEKISEKHHLDIYNKWNAITVIDNTNYSLIWKVAIVASLLLVFLLFRTLITRHYNQQLEFKNKELTQLKSALEKSNKELENQANHDALTNLHNRRFFNNMFDGFKYDESMSTCLILIDIDHFKRINDEYGHVAGDQVLTEFSTILKQQDVDSKCLVRWGGEEFIIFLKRKTLTQARELSETIQKSLQQFDFSYVNNLTCSFGIAKMEAKESLNQCLNRADFALYNAKEQGRNKITIA